jgi:hypothetical protein
MIVKQQDKIKDSIGLNWIKIRFCFLNVVLHYNRGTQYRSWLRHYVTSSEVMGSIPSEVIRFFS